MTYCDDCPDREACHQGMSCDLSKRFAVAASLLYPQKMKGTTMSNAKNASVTPADVVAKATEEKLVVPAQAEGEKTDATPESTEEQNTGEAEKLTVVDGGKKSLKERLAAVTEKLKENKKAVLAVGAAASVAALAFAKYAKKKAEEALVVDEETVAEDCPVETADESAA